MEARSLQKLVLLLWLPLLCQTTEHFDTEKSCPSHFVLPQELQPLPASLPSAWQYKKMEMNTTADTTQGEPVSPQLLSVLNDILQSPTLSEDGLCGEHTIRALQASSRLELWALKMFDASAKIPSGLLNGNVNQLGDFDQCLSINHGDISGQYCLAYIDLNPTDNAGPRLRNALRMARSYDLIRSNVTDPGHRVPRYTSFHWATCVPASCSAQQVELGLRRALATLNTAPELQVRRLVLAFSLRRSWSNLVSTRAPTNDVSAIHGVRFLNAIGLLICHKSMALFFDPFVNRTVMAERMTHPWTVIGRTAILYTDSFILISGLLVTHALLPELDRRKGRMDIRSKYTTRFLRITPNLVAIILFCTYVMQLMGSGPLWSTVVQHYSDMCKQHMWRNFLYIHNYFGFEEMCLTHTHQLGIDMQLYLVSPFLVYLLWRWPRAGFMTLVTIAGFSTWLRYVVTYAQQLSSVVYFGITIRRMFDTANYSYILPTHRITAYIIGIFLGYYLKRNPDGLKLTKAQTVLGWTITGVAAAIPWFSPYPGCSKDFQYDATNAAIYSAFYPLFWCTFISGLILMCHQNRGGWIGVFLRWKGFLIFTRIAYAVYLTQFPIFFYNIGTRRHAGFSSITDLINLSEFLAVFVASFILTLFIDLPFQEVKKVITEKKVIKDEPQLDKVEETEKETSHPNLVKRNKVNSG
ncbi:hypothetical protein B566_EDAN006442 [Ephemera danica]|nr:hypothetical protein B566_EDAN006442 [Ephemera danica]